MRISDWSSDVCSSDLAALDGEVEGADDPGGDRLALEQAIGKVRLRLKRVAEGVAEVEKGAAVARLALVLGADPGIARRAGGAGMVKRGANPATDHWACPIPHSGRTSCGGTDDT